MKKTVIILLMLFFALSVSAKSLSFWHSYRGDEKKALEKLAKEYEKKYQVKIKILAIPNDAFDKKLTASIPRGQGPDVFIFANDKIGQWVESGLLESLDYWTSGTILRSFIKRTVMAMVYKKSIYSLPLAFKVPVLYYNKQFIDTPPKTFKELIDISKKIMGKHDGVYGLGYDNTNLFFHSMLHFGFNGELFDDDKKVLIAEKEAVDALSYAKYLAIDTKIMPEEINSALLSTMFNQNKLLFVINGPWFAGEIKPTIGYDIALIPTAQGRTLKPYMSIEGVFMNKFSKKKIEAFHFMKYLIEGDQALVRMLEGKQSVATLSPYKRSKVKENKKLEIFQQQAELATPISSNPIMSFFWAPMAQALKKIINNNYDPKKALNESKSKIEEQLSK